MSSLTAHLLEPGDHGRLGFHPSCPVCRRERLFGSLSSEPVVSRRVQAALATGVLALSATAPGTVAASGPDREQEGVVAPAQPPAHDTEHATGDAIDEPGFDPGGETALPLSLGPERPTPTEDDQVTDDVGPVESEPVDDPYARVVAPDEPDRQAPPLEDAPARPTDAVPVAPVAPAASEPAPMPTPAPSAKHPGDTGQPGTTKAPERTGKSGRKKEDDSTKRTARPVREQSTPAAPRTAPKAPVDAPVLDTSPPVDISPVGISEASAPAPAQATAATASQRVVVAQRGAAAERDRTPAARKARFRIVKSGDSLWSIARKLLGPSASPAQIAREVDRLWELNKDRIGTGNRDLLMVGTKLRLR
jgi:nucleoid-associated protein YgaU